MIKADREVLARVLATNRVMGEVVVSLLAVAHDSGDLPAGALRPVAGRLAELGQDLMQVAEAMIARADEIDQAASPALPAGTVTGPGPATTTGGMS